MEIDRIKKKDSSVGRCFQCHKKGHLSKNCLHKRVEVHAVAMPEEALAKDTKVEEAKD